MTQLGLAERDLAVSKAEVLGEGLDPTFDSNDVDKDEAVALNPPHLPWGEATFPNYLTSRSVRQVKEGECRANQRWKPWGHPAVVPCNTFSKYVPYKETLKN